jgi:hypothetical protein
MILIGIGTSLFHKQHIAKPSVHRELLVKRPTRCQAVNQQPCPHIWKSVLTEYFANRHFDVANALDTMTPDQCQIVQSLAETVLSYEVKFGLFFIILLIVILLR